MASLSLFSLCQTLLCFACGFIIRRELALLGSGGLRFPGIWLKGPLGSFAKDIVIVEGYSSPWTVDPMPPAPKWPAALEPRRSAPPLATWPTPHPARSTGRTPACQKCCLCGGGGQQPLCSYWSTKGCPHFKKVQFFWTLFKRPLTPPPPFIWTFVLFCGGYFLNAFLSIENGSNNEKTKKGRKKIFFGV